MDASKWTLFSTMMTMTRKHSIKQHLRRLGSQQVRERPSFSMCDLSSSSRIADPRPSKKRERCPYGKFCYRKNPVHLQQAIHPGDPDWDDKENDTSDTKPICPYGSECYRKNPEHFNEYDHTRTKAPRNSSKKRRGKSSRPMQWIRTTPLF